MAEPAVLVISLDFELFWGVRGVTTLDRYRENLLGERKVVPRLLRLFAEFDVHATWATVGFLYFRTRDELLEHLPRTRPDYDDASYSPYAYLESIGSDEEHDPFHFAPSLVDMIRASPNQEIATHTFSHYYALEPGQTADAFRADLECAAAVARARGDELESIVFPRNQVNPAYLPICRELGLKAYRGTEPSWIWRASKESDHTLPRRAVRLVDAFVPVSSTNAYARDLLDGDVLVNIPSSRFLRPYSRRLRALEPLRIRRIATELDVAARDGLIYHLWWHPHNFGSETEENFTTLRRILEHFASVRERYGMISANMAEVARMGRAA